LPFSIDATGVTSLSLPLKTTADDVRQIVEYLKNKPAGATASEAKAVLGSQTLDGRKISAYQTWNVVSKDGDRLKLTPLGWEMARNPGNEHDAVRQILDSVVPYRSALEWMHHEGLDSVTTSDVGAQWHSHHSTALGTDSESSIRDNAISFFHLADAAGLGSLTLGRRGQPTRLALEKPALKGYIEAGPSAPPWTSSVEDAVDEEETETTATAEAVDEEPAGPDGNGSGPRTSQTPPSLPEQMRAFIAHGDNMEIVEQVETMLGVADIEHEVAEEEETTAIPVPDKVLDAMRRCKVGVIVVSASERHKNEAGEYTINENVLIEIGAAFVLYDRKVVLVWDKRLPVPSNLQGLYRCEYEGDELTWSAGMKLMKAIQKFRS
jgi:hypothetical protein